MTGTVLLVDDDIGTISTVRRLLERRGLEVSLSTSISDAQVSLGIEWPDVVLLASNIESGRGADWAFELLQAGLPTVLLGGGAQVAGVDTLVFPISGEELLEAIGRAQNLKNQEGVDWASATVSADSPESTSEVEESNKPTDEIVHAEAEVEALATLERKLDDVLEHSDAELVSFENQVHDEARRRRLVTEEVAAGGEALVAPVAPTPEEAVESEAWAQGLLDDLSQDSTAPAAVDLAEHGWNEAEERWPVEEPGSSTQDAVDLAEPGWNEAEDRWPVEPPGPRAQDAVDWVERVTERLANEERSLGQGPVASAPQVEPSEPPEPFGAFEPFSEPPDVDRLISKHDQAQDSDYFSMLGLQRSADKAQIALAYENLVSEFHPLRFAGHPDVAVLRRAEQLKKMLDEAAQILDDDGLRAQYARALSD